MNAPPSNSPGLLARFSVPLSFVGLGVLVFGVLVAMGAAAEAPTVGLSFVGVCLVLAIWRMFRVVHALAVPANTGLEVRRTGGARRARLEDEFQRLLRSIKELEFDHEMGKISSEDFENLEGTYRARAIEVMRELQKTEELHPELQELLDVREEERSGLFALPDADAGADPMALSGERPPAEASADEASEVDSAADEASQRICPSCGGANDDDAKFCKHCGKELAA